MSSHALRKPFLSALLVGVALLVAVAHGTAGAAEPTAHATSTALSCDPSEGAVELARSCTATVTDTSSEPTTPTGELFFPGAFRCVLVAAGPNSATCRVRVRAEVAGTYLVEVTYQGDATHASSAGTTTLVSGAPGSPSEPAATLNWATVEVPSLKLEEAPPKKSRSRVATFKFSAEKFAVGFECRVDKGPFKACTSPYTAKVAPGRHTFLVRALSATGAYRHAREWRWTVLPKK